MLTWIQLLPLLLVVGTDAMTSSKSFPYFDFEERRLDSSSSATTTVAVDVNMYPADSVNTQYEGYQQAWRMLGIYVDCSGMGTYDQQQQAQQQGNGDHHDDRNKKSPCQRYLLWAAYIDPNYGGDGANEYQHYDTSSGAWDTKYCKDGSRCAKLDCHDPTTTTWELLGIYKEAAYGSEWFEQLFKHAGYCLWDGDTFNFMHSNYNDWPESCQQSKVSTSSGTSLYIYLEPGQSMIPALYTDDICRTRYTGSDVSLETALAASGYLFGDSLKQFNKDLAVYQICQNCRAITQTGGGDGGLDCYDYAGYTNVNQCMKFRTHTNLLPADWKDVQIALAQGAIESIVLAGSKLYTSTASLNGSTMSSMSSTSSVLAPLFSKANPLFIASLVALAVSILAFWVVLSWKMIRRRKRRTLSQRFRDPLIAKAASY